MSRLFKAVATAALSAAVVILVGPATPVLHAQPKTNPPAVPGTYPTLTSPMNLGVKRGTTTELTLTGTNLSDVTSVWLSCSGKITIPEGQKDPAKLKLSVAVPPEAPIGLHFLRVGTKSGVSNIRSLVVDELPEVEKKPGNSKKDSPQVVTTPCVISGSIGGESSDFYKFSVKAGETLTIEALGRRLGSPIDPVLIVYNAQGQEVPGLYADDTPGLQTDARVTHTFATAGDFIVEIRDTTYRGGGDFVYRLRIGNFPGATTAFPLFAQVGKPAEIGFAGPDLAGVKPVKISPQAKDSVVYVAPHRDGGLSGWPVPVRVSDIPESAEQEPNNEIAKANKLTVPGGISARFLEKNDIDYFAFPGKKGQKLLIEALTYELNAPTEVYMRVVDGKGAELAKSNPQQPTPRIEFTPGADGEFYITCEQTNFASGPNEIYHVSIRPVAPDFTVTLGVDRIDIPAGGTGLIPITGVARLNGFNAPIDLTFVGNDGITGKLTIPPGANPQPVATYFLPLTVKPGTTPTSVIGKVFATAKVETTTISHTASVFEITKAALGNMPTPPHELADQVAVAIIPEPPFNLTLNLEKTEVTKGGTLKGKFVTKRVDKFAEDIVITGISVPTNAAPTLKPIPKTASEVEVSIAVPANVGVGPAVLIFRGTAKIAGKDVGFTAPVVNITVTEPKKEEPKKKDEPKKK